MNKKKVWILLLVLGFLLALLVGKQSWRSSPTTTEILWDTYGIPHIYAQNEKDAFTVLGYVHAQDRLWQMELLRRVGKGGLSEVFGRDLVKTDKFFLSLGIDEASQKTVSRLNKDSEAITLCQAYLDGINRFIEEGPTPIEFHLTGLDKTPFTITDVYNTIGYMAFSFATAYKTDPLLTNIKDKLGPEYLKDLGISPNDEYLRIKNYPKNVPDSLLNSIPAMVSQALDQIDLPLFHGSNSWVLAPEKTKNGKVILANDPHIGFSQPSVWYEAHVVTPTYEKYGYHMAGIPYPILAHDRKLAFGMTMFLFNGIPFFL